jgi:plastocyanin
MQTNDRGERREEEDMGHLTTSVGALGVAVVLAACGGGGDGGDGGGGGGATLSMTDNAFSPADLTVSSGDTVELSNDGQAVHNLTIEGTDVDENVDPGSSSSLTVDAEPGDYTMFCEFHRGAGMEGTVTVQ